MIDKIRDVIGTGGKVIREITETTGVKMDVEDDGTIKVAAANQESIDAAVKWIKDLTDEPEVGKVYDGKVVKTVDFGAFVTLWARKTVLFISELQDTDTNTTDVVNEGDEVKVLLAGIDDRGKIKLSMKRVDQETGERSKKTKRLK